MRASSHTLHNISCHIIGTSLTLGIIISIFFLLSVCLSVCQSLSLLLPCSILMHTFTFFCFHHFFLIKTLKIKFYRPSLSPWHENQLSFVCTSVCYALKLRQRTFGGYLHICCLTLLLLYAIPICITYATTSALAAATQVSVSSLVSHSLPTRFNPTSAAAQVL